MHGQLGACRRSCYINAQLLYVTGMYDRQSYNICEGGGAGWRMVSGVVNTY